jgi:hypothetical protein
LLGGATALAQKWSMFDHPPSEDVWYVAYAEIGKRPIDLLTGGAPTGEKPRSTSADLPNQNWRHFFWRLNASEGERFRKPAADYLCRRWNETHPTAHADDMRLVAYGERRSEAPGETEAYPYVRWTARAWCGAVDARR